MDSSKTQTPGQQASEYLKASVILVENSALSLKKPQPVINSIAVDMFEKKFLLNSIFVLVGSFGLQKHI